VANGHVRQSAEKAEAARGEAEVAYRLAQMRVIEGQVARAQIEARLLNILQEFKRYDAYKGTMEASGNEFQMRAA
jgi:hypothetical protein